MPSVLLTRPAHLSAPLAEKLAAEGWTVYQAPLLSYRDAGAPWPDLSPYDGLVFTSRQGVAAFARHNRRNNMAVFAVGDATAQAASDAGFTDIRIAGGTVESLARLIGESAPQKLLHVGGADIAGDLSALFPGIDRHIAYHADLVDDMPQESVAALEGGKIDAVLLFSPRTSAQFAAVIGRRQLAPRLKTVAAYCFSAAIAEKLGGLSFRKVEIAEKTSLPSILALLNRDKK